MLSYVRAAVLSVVRRIRRGGPPPPPRHAARAAPAPPELAGWQRWMLDQLAEHYRSFSPAAARHGQRLAYTLRRQVGETGDVQIGRLLLTVLDYLDDVLAEVEPDEGLQAAAIGEMLGGAVIELTEQYREMA